MKTFLLCLALLALTGAAQAQTQTRVTPCNPATPNNAICVTWPVPTMLDGSAAAQPMTYRVERRIGATGVWDDVALTALATQFYQTGLAAGEYFYRIYSTCANCTAESGVSNTASRSTAPRVTNPAVITIAVVISPDAPPTVVEVNGSQVYASTRP